MLIVWDITKTPFLLVHTTNSKSVRSVRRLLLFSFTLFVLIGKGSLFAQIQPYHPPPQLAPPSDRTSSQPNILQPTTITAPPAPAPSSPDIITQPKESSNSTPVTASGLSSMQALDDKVALRDGDRISFRVIEDQDDAVPRLITDNGEVDFPYVGRIKVAGRTCKDVAEQLKKLLEVDYYKRATVIVGLDVIAPTPPPTPEKEVHRYVWIVGQVRQVGAIEITPDLPLTVSQVVLRSGGFGDFADQRKVKLIHHGAGADGAPASDTGGGEVIDVKSVYEGKSANDPRVQPNDLVVVPKRAVNF